VSSGQKASLKGDCAVSTLNPYDRFLDGRPLQDILFATTNAIAYVLAVIGNDKVATAPAPGKWSPAQIVCHLADCELVFAFRLRQTLAEDTPTIQPFDQDKWAETYAGASAGQALGVFDSLRRWNLRLIGAALPTSAGRLLIHPERGTMTYQTIVETMAGHDLNHLGQLHKLAGS
jgi:uncharacterized damage-inducible protein DinB